MYAGFMEWFCILLVAGIIIVFLFIRIISLENRVAFLEQVTRSLEFSKPKSSLSDEIPEDLKPPILETEEPTVSNTATYHYDHSPSATGSGKIETPMHLSQAPEQTPEPQPEKN